VHFTPALNIILGSAILVILICIDYMRKYNTDACQRRLFLDLLGFTLLAMLSDFVFYLVLGIPGKTFHNVLYVAILGYYFFQNLAFYYSFLFLDFIFTKNQRRTAAFRIIVWIITVLHCFVLFLNHKWQFYFTITGDNLLSYGDYYFVRMVISYLPVVLLGLDILLFFKNIKTNPVTLILCLFILTGVSSTIDLLFKTTSLIWPCFAGALLYAYFFVIQTDSKIDALTGLGNRNSFNEFVSKLSAGRLKHSEQRFPGRKSTAASYSVAMLDMDHFKMINDTMGHLEGDNALRDMAGIIKSCVRSGDFAARYGGDEFVLATREENGITPLLERIQTAINDLNAKNTRPYKLQISYGHDVYNANSGTPITDFLKHIDGLMYKHKNERRRSSDKENKRRKEENAAVLH
jgi:diguanylate cyclase (GGDEF)-like protein